LQDFKTKETGIMVDILYFDILFLFFYNYKSYDFLQQYQ